MGVSRIRLPARAPERDLTARGRLFLPPADGRTPLGRVVDPEAEFRAGYVIQHLVRGSSDSSFAFGAGGDGGFTGEARAALRRAGCAFAYMGAAEYEHGWVAAAFAAAEERAGDYTTITLRIPWDLVAHDGSRGAPAPAALPGEAVVEIFCHERHATGMSEVVQRYAWSDSYIPDGTLGLKDPTQLGPSLRARAEGAHRPRDPVGWVDLRNAAFFFIDPDIARRLTTLLRHED